jgi:hypothetical protein
MALRSVYLGHVDIGPDAKLELKRQHADATDDEVLLYQFRYGLVADQVLMQGSAPLKSRQVLLIYLRLLEAFKRNENHEPIPVFAFALSDDAEGYTEYILDRIHMLRGTGNANAESNAYQMNNAVDAAKQLDSELSMVDVPRRKRSVSKAFRHGLLALLRSNEPKSSGISLETSERAIEKIGGSEQIQTFKLISSLNLKEAEQARALYQATRHRYRQANALGIVAMNSDDSPVWASSHIARFLDAIGLQPWISDTRNLTAELLFKIRRIESYRALREEYFNAQSDADLVELTTMLRNLRLNGKVLSTVRQSPGALAALVFEGLNELKIGYKSLNKAGELITKTVFSDLADEHFAKRCYRLHSLVDQLERDTCGLIPRST